MSTFALKLNAAKQSASWQLALDKFPFNLGKTSSPSLTEPDDKGKEQSIKPHRLREVRDRYTAAKPSLDDAAKRQQEFLATLARQHGPRFRRVTLVNSSRLLLHLGRSSVLENVGLHCERTTGLPVIPGTAVKGVVSTWACWAENQDRETFSVARSGFSPEVARVLGSNPANDPAARDAAGCITFLGGYPQSAPSLELDIVTPHPEEGRGRITPSPFLAIKPDTKWDFVLIASSRLAESEVAPVLDAASAWLGDCLTQIGLGAKTAAGYGNFRFLTESEKQHDATRFGSLLQTLQESAAREDMSDDDRAYHDFVKAVTDWAPLAREIASKPEPDKSHILRFFRSEEGKAVIKNWPNNDKAKARKQALKDAGL